MQTTSDIANFALAALGAGQINSISDSGDAAILCSNWVADAIEAVLLEGQFQAHIKRTQLLPTGTGIDDYLYTYELPNDLVTIISLLETSSLGNAMVTSVPMFSISTPQINGIETGFYLESGKMYANYSPVVLKYLATPTNLGDMSLYVGHAIGYKLAGIVGPGLSVEPQKLAWVESKYKESLGMAGRFEKRDRRTPRPYRKWGDPA